MSQPQELPNPRGFSHDLTHKSIFAEPDTIHDLIAFLAVRECPELQGFVPVQVVAGSSVEVDPEHHPHQIEGHRDMVWLLARAEDAEDKLLLHLEFQSQRASDMSDRMFAYARRMGPSLSGLEVLGLVVNTGLHPFGVWWCPVQTVLGSRRYGFREGALLDIHDYAVPGLEGGGHQLPRHNLVSGFVALARLQVAMQQGNRSAVELVLPVLRDGIIPRALEATETTRRAFATWLKTGFGLLFADLPELRVALGKIMFIEEAEAVMYTFGQYVKDKVQEGVELGKAQGVELGRAQGVELGKAQGVELGKAQGVELGKARGEVQGEKRVLLKFIRQVWGDSEAERFARELDAADLRDLPDITDLMEDQTAGRLPRLRRNGRNGSRT